MKQFFEGAVHGVFIGLAMVGFLTILMALLALISRS